MTDLASVLRSPGEATPPERDGSSELARMLRQIQVRAMSGLDPTPEQAALLAELQPEKEERGSRLATLGAELSGIPQAMRAGAAISEAAQDPSIASGTNAATQTALAAFRPALAVKTLGGGYLASLLKDMGILGGPSSAEAQAAKKGGGPVMPGLTPEQQSMYDAADKRLKGGDFGSQAERRQLEESMRELRSLSNESIRQKNVGAQDEYNRQVTGAEAARDKELARDRRFSETEVGKLWDKSGGLAPALAGVATGSVMRAAHGPKVGVAPIGWGAGAGASAVNIPLAYNAFMTEPDNPQKRAYDAYARELPPNHPRRQEWKDYAAGLPATNPVREAAAKELYDPTKFAERAVMGGLEGGLGGMLGADKVGIFGRAGEGASSLLGRFLRGPKDPPTKVGTDAGIPASAGSASTRPIVGEASSPSSQTGGLSTMLRNSPSPQRQLPAPGAPSNRPSWASDPPEGVRIDKGYYWDASVGQQRHEKGGFGPAVKYSPGRVKTKEKTTKSDDPAQSSVQIDDMKPLRYED